MSPTLICTRSRSVASSVACVPLPLPCTPMITYFRMTPAWHATRGASPPAPLQGLRHQRETALAPAAQPRVEPAAQHRPVLAEQARVQEPGHVVAAALRQHDAVQAAPELLVGQVELAGPRPGEVPGQPDDAAGRPAQLLDPLGQPPGRPAAAEEAIGTGHAEDYR